MICRGCQADLNKAIIVPLNIMWGRLAIKCPLCKFIQKVRIKDDGTVEAVIEEVTE